MTESAKATPPNQENPYPPVISYPGPFNSSAYPPPGPPGAYPPFFPYPPPPDGAHTEGTQNGGPPGPYMMYAPPPGVMYYPHAQPQGMLYFIVLTYSHWLSHVGFGAQPAASPVPATLSRPKRKQVKMAVSTISLHWNKLFIRRNSAQIVQEPVSAAMKLVLVRDVSSMVLAIPVSMVKGKRGRKALSVAHTNARTKTTPPTILVKFHIAFYERTRN